MGLSVEAVSRLRKAFDRHAGSYDSLFSGNLLARDMRRRTWRVLDSLFPSGSRVVDLGCGTGEDVLHLAGRGVSVRAVDLAEDMLECVRQKTGQAGVGHLVDCESGDYSKLSGLPGEYDGIYSNFGALNCVSDMGWLARAAPRVLKPRAHMVLVLMSPFYPLEFVANVLKGRFRSAIARWRPRAIATVEGVDLDVYYHGLGHLRRVLGSRFTLEHAEGLNLFTPVPALEHLDVRFRRVFDMIRPVDLWLSRHRPMSGIGDHFMSVWRLRAERHR